MGNLGQCLMVFTLLITYASAQTYYKFIYYWNPNWWSGNNAVQVTYETNSGAAASTMQKCSGEGWFYQVLSSDDENDGTYVVFDSGGVYDDYDCQSEDNYGTAFDGAYMSVSTNNSNNCGGTINYFFYPDASVVGADCMTPTFKRVFYYNPVLTANGVPSINFPNYGSGTMTQCSNGWYYRQVAAVGTNDTWVIFYEGSTYDDYACTPDLNYNLTFDGGYAAIYTNTSNGCGGMIINPFVPTESEVGANCLGLAYLPVPIPPTPTATPTPPPVYQYYKFVYYWNPNWWNGSTVKVTYNTYSQPLTVPMTKCSANGWFYQVLTSDIRVDNYVVFDNGTTYDNHECQGLNNYVTGFDGAYILIATNNSKNCNGSINFFFYPDASVVGADCMTPTFKRVYYYNPDYYNYGSANILFPNYGNATMTQCTNGWYYRQVAVVNTNYTWVIFEQSGNYDNYACVENSNYNLTFDGGYAAVITTSKSACGGSITDLFVPSPTQVGANCVALSLMPTSTATPTPTPTSTPTSTPTPAPTQVPTDAITGSTLILTIQIVNLYYTKCLVTSGDNTTFQQLLRMDLANILAISISDIIVTSLMPGSIIANVTVITLDPSSVLSYWTNFINSSNPSFFELTTRLPSRCFAPGQSQAMANPAHSFYVINDATSSDDNSDANSNGWEIAVALVVVIVVLVALGLAIGYVWFRRKDQFVSESDLRKIRRN